MTCFGMVVSVALWLWGLLLFGQVYTLGGEYLSCIGGQKGPLLYQLNRPWGVAACGDLLFVTDRLNNCVKVRNWAPREGRGGGGGGEWGADAAPAAA